MSIVGLDISHWQGTIINWQKMVSAGVKFIYLKCTEGTFYKDDTFANNYTSAKKLGLKVGAYHFVRGSDAESQFQWFKQGMGNRIFDLPPALDVEVSSLSEALVDSLGRKLENYMGANPEQFLLYPRPAIYTNTSLGNSIFKSPNMSRYPLWLATRNTTKPDIPKIWKQNGLYVWQDAVTSGVPYGIKGNVDHNYWGTAIPFPDDNPPTPPPVVTKEFKITVEIGVTEYSSKVKLEKL